MDPRASWWVKAEDICRSFHCNCRTFSAEVGQVQEERVGGCVVQRHPCRSTRRFFSALRHPAKLPLIGPLRPDKLASPHVFHQMKIIKQVLVQICRIMGRLDVAFLRRFVDSYVWLVVITECSCPCFSL